MTLMRRGFLALLTAAFVLAGGGVRSADGVAETEQPFSTERIEELVAPIALYPDSLVAQILMASTYPLDIVQAARWVKENPDLEGAELEEALAPHEWDPSVKALTNFPDVLARMNDNLDWTQDLGDAVLANQQEVMDAIQRMRRYAKDAGNLKTTEEQKVVVQEKVIVIEPATEVVYVPAYNPVVVYGTYWRPVHYYYPIYRYPPSYWYPPGYAASNIISFGIGMAVGAAIWGNWSWGHCNWRGNKIEINNNFNFNRNINTRDINIGNRGGGRYSGWEHNPQNRRGVRYRDQQTRDKFAGRNRDSSALSRVDRDAARGFDRADRSGRDRPATGEGGRARPSTRDLEKSLAKAGDGAAGDRARPATRDRDRETGGGKAAARPGGDRSRPAGSASGPSDRAAKRSSPAFKSEGSDGFERAASRRGGQSRAAARAGGGGRAAGGGARR